MCFVSRGAFTLPIYTVFFRLFTLLVLQAVRVRIVVGCCAVFFVHLHFTIGAPAL